MPQSSRLLILACSRAKRPDPSPIPALDRYDGPAFRVLRSYLRSSPAAAPDVWVLSAEHGLMPAHTIIAPYDRRMTTARAHELQPIVEPTVSDLASGRPTCLALGWTYHRALGEAAPHALRPGGGLGTQLAGLKRWLNGSGCHIAPPAGLPPVLAGLVSTTPSDAARLACSLAASDQAATRLGAYAVSVGTLRVAPKWLVSQLAGVPVSRFRTADALRALAYVGLHVEPV